DLTVSAVVSGTGFGLTKAGLGTMSFSGTTANTYTGATTVNEGELDLNKNAGVNAVAGPLVIGDDAGGVGADVVRFGSNNDQIANTAAVTVKSSGLLDLFGRSETIGPLTLTGGTVSTGTGTLTLGGNVTTTASSVMASIEGKLALGATRTFAVPIGSVAPDLSISAVISGSGGLTKT